MQGVSPEDRSGAGEHSGCGPPNPPWLRVGVGPNNGSVITRALFALVVVLAALRAGASAPGEEAWPHPKAEASRLKVELIDSASTATLVLAPLPANKAVSAEDATQKRTRIG